MKKTKKALLAALACSAALAGAIGFAACDNGGDDGTTTPPAHEHVWSWTVAKQPTAETTGKVTRTCTGTVGECDWVADDLEDVLPVLDDEGYIVGKDSATCTTAGTQTYTIAKDGKVVRFDVETSVKADAHDYGEYVNTDAEGHYKVCKNNAEHVTEKEAHNEAGEDGACSVCGYIEHVHAWSWTVTDEDKPSEETEGKATGTCFGKGVCDATDEDKEYPLPVLTSEDYAKSEDSATCIEGGFITYTYNKDDVNVSFMVETPVNSDAHDYDYAADAEGHYQVCKNNSEHTTDKVEHTEQTLDAKAATCTETGLTEGKECSVCHTVLEEQEVIAAKGHSINTDVAHTVDETAKTVSARCATCDKEAIYEYDNAVLDAEGAQTGKASPLAEGVNYVTQKTANPYLSYTFGAGTHTIYWVSLNNSTFTVSVATFDTTTKGMINSTSIQKNYLPDDFALEGYCTGDMTYYVDNVQTFAHKGDYLRLTRDEFSTSQTSLGISSFTPVKLTFTISEEKTLKFRNPTGTVGGGCFLISIDKEPTALTNGSITAGEFTVKDSGLGFEAVTEEAAGTYTFTAENGIFELFVNDETKSYFGYVDFCDRYRTVTLQAGDVVKVVKISGRASEKTITIHEGALEEPATPEYRTLQLGDQTITLTATNIATGKYDDATEKFYTFTAAESGYYAISVADDVIVSVVIKVDKTHYSFVLDVTNMNKHSGVFYAEAGKKLIIAFTGNNTTEFTANIASCDEPVTYLEVNEKLENIAFTGFESFVKLTVGDSVAEGTYQITFEVSNSLLRSYIYFTVGEEIEVEDQYDSNAVAEYVNADLKAGANNTVGAGTRSDESDELSVKEYKDYTRTVTLKAGDVIYLATTALTPGNVSITLTPVEEAE